MIVPRDKTRSYMIVPTTKYCIWVNDILVTQAIEITKEDLGIIYNKCIKVASRHFSHVGT